jgi:hypothetical protein
LYEREEDKWRLWDFDVKSPVPLTVFVRSTLEAMSSNFLNTILIHFFPGEWFELCSSSRELIDEISVECHNQEVDLSSKSRMSRRSLRYGKMIDLFESRWPFAASAGTVGKEV